MNSDPSVCLFVGDDLGRYGFGHGHPFGPERMHVFWEAVQEQGLDKQVQLCEPQTTTRDVIEQFHSAAYVDKVIARSISGEGFLDAGDTPAFPGMLEAASFVVGTTLAALDKIMDGNCKRAFVPIAGLHHARRNTAAGFCVFNDCGVAIEVLRSRYGLQRIAYVDIDAHHGDGVFYEFENDPDLIFADLHEDGKFLYPGTGDVSETGKGEADGTKLNVPMPPDATDEMFMKVWPTVEAFLEKSQPEFIILQCGADSIAGDPITHLRYSEAAHAHATRRLCHLADAHCDGRLLALGGGGYNHNNIAHAWTAVLQALVDA